MTEKPVPGQGMADWIMPDWPAPAPVKAFVTTRSGGFSAGAYHSLNLGVRCGDDPLAVARNRSLVCQHLPAAPVWLDQVHGSGVLDLIGRGSNDIPDRRFDALVSDGGQVAVVLTADCLPVLLCDDKARYVAAVHCGWRGLAGGILQATIDRIPVAPGRLMAWLGPAIGPERYEVGIEVRQAMIERVAAAAAAFVPVRRGHWLCDLYRIARVQLTALGVEQVFGGKFCTFKEEQRFYSYRRDRRTGRFGSFIWLNGNA